MAAPGPLRQELVGQFDYRFQRLIVSHTFDTIGNTLVAIALAGTLFFSIPAEEARGRVLLYLLVTVTPFAVVSALLGPLLDRGVALRRLAVVAAGLARAVLAWMMAVRTESLLLFPLALGVLVAQRFYSITRASLVPACVPVTEPLVNANAFLTRTSAVTGTITAVLGVATERAFGSQGVLRAATIAYLLMGIAGLMLPTTGVRRRGGATQVEEVVEPARAVMLAPGFRAIAAMRLLSGFLLFQLAFTLRREGAGTTGFGVLLLGIGIGALLSSVLAPVLNKFVREDLLIFGSYLACGVATLLAAQVFSRVSSAVLAAVVGAAFGISKVSYDSMAQRGLPRRVQGRLFARWEMAFQLLWAAGAVIPVAVTLSTRPTLVVAGLATIGGAVAYAVDVSRTRRQASAPA